jgi:hypothetical protein
MNESNGWRAAGGRMTCSGARGEEADGEGGGGEEGRMGIDGVDERRERRGRGEGEGEGEKKKRGGGGG